MFQPRAHEAEGKQSGEEELIWFGTLGKLIYRSFVL